MATIYIKDYDTEVEIPENADMKQVQAALAKQFPAKSPEVPKSDTASVPEWGAKYPNLYGVAGASRETLGPIIEALGMAGGAAAGTVGATPGAGTVAGAGLGYAGAHNLLKQIDYALGNKKDPGVGENLKNLPSEVATGAAMEAGGQALGAGVGMGLDKLKGYAPNLYESALKPSTTLKESVRNARVNTALEEGLPVSKKGLETSRETISQINKRVKDTIENATGVTISRDRALQPVGELSNKVQATKIDADSDLTSIAKYVDEIQASQPERIPIQQAQVFKQTLNKELNEYYAAYSRGKATPPQVYAKTKASMANGLRSEITDMYPEIKNLNQKEGALIELNKSLERAVNRIRNREIIPLLSGIALGTSTTHGVLKALVIKAIEHPEVKSRLAIAIYKASKPKAASMATAAVRSGVALNQ